MNIELFSLLLAAGGGFLGAAIGGLFAFIFTGFMVLIGTGIVMAGGSPAFLNDMAFGPVFGPHIAFAGGVAAVAFAARRPARVGARETTAVEAGVAEHVPVRVGGRPDAPAVSDVLVAPDTGRNPDADPASDVGGKDIGISLVALERPAVLLVGAAAGMAGYLVQRSVAALPWFGAHTDSVALTVVLLALATRLLFGRTGLFGGIPGRADGVSGWGRFAPRDGAQWIKYHERFVPNTVLGLFVGLLAAGTTVLLARAYPALGASASSVMFGVSALSLLFLSLGVSFPVTHHITLVAGVAAYQFLPLVHGNEVLAMLIGMAAGTLSAWLAEFFARVWHDHGDTHIDPPAAAIWPATTLVLGLAALLS